MATHIIVFLPVPSVMIQKIHSILSTFFWGENNGKGKKKWGASHELCEPVEEGGIRDMGDIMKAFRMKFSCCLLFEDNQWTNFFKLSM